MKKLLAPVSLAFAVLAPLFACSSDASPASAAEIGSADEPTEATRATEPTSSSSGDVSKPPAGSENAVDASAAPDAAAKDGGSPPPVSTAGSSRAAAGNDCCYEGDYFICPNTTACMGGFDLLGCLKHCGDNGCRILCNRKAAKAPPPQGCEPQAEAPPANVACGQSE